MIADCVPFLVEAVHTTINVYGGHTQGYTRLLMMVPCVLCAGTRVHVSTAGKLDAGDKVPKRRFDPRVAGEPTCV